MNTETRIYLKKKFKEYYWKNKVAAPKEVWKREFGVGTLEDKIKSRHKSFKTDKDLQYYLQTEAPYYVSYSIAYYNYPENQPMTAKEWLGADLVFDLDLDMKYFDAGLLEEVKGQALNLIDFLTGDFGFSEKDVEVNFSGSKGYHIHVSNDSVRNLGSDERREIVDYVTGNLNFEEYLKIEGSTILGPKKGDGGWAGRIYNGLYGFIRDSTKEKLKEIDGIGEKKAEEILRSRERILQWLEAGRYDCIPGIVTFEKSSFKTPDPNVRVFPIKSVNAPIVDKIIKEKSIKIVGVTDADKMVTPDTSRLIRLPDSLHGGSGLKAAKVANLQEFNPLRDALAFKGGSEVRIKMIADVPEFDLNDTRLGPYKTGEEANTPECAGIYLLLKDCAEVIPQ